MFQFKTTRWLVPAALCLLCTEAKAQMQAAAVKTAPSSAGTEYAAAFRLSGVTIGGQTFLIAQDSMAGEQEDGTVSDQCLVAMLNFFLEVPATGKTPK